MNKIWGMFALLLAIAMANGCAKDRAISSKGIGSSTSLHQNYVGNQKSSLDRFRVDSGNEEVSRSSSKVVQNQVCPVTGEPVDSMGGAISVAPAIADGKVFAGQQGGEGKRGEIGVAVCCQLWSALREAQDRRDDRRLPLQRFRRLLSSDDDQPFVGVDEGDFLGDISVHLCGSEDGGDVGHRVDDGDRVYLGQDGGSDKKQGQDKQGRGSK